MVDEVGESQPSFDAQLDLHSHGMQEPMAVATGRSPTPRLVVAESEPTPPEFATSADEFGQLKVVYDGRARVLWYYMMPTQRPSFTRRLLGDIRGLQIKVADIVGPDANSQSTPIRYLVLASRIQGVFNLGGDLRHIGRLVRNQDRVGLTEYARACIDVLFQNVIGLDLPIVTVSLVQGHALGGGFEAALSSKLIIAEQGTKFGFPEVLFNLFPGMGAYSLLARRIGPIDAERMITSGKTYPADELYELGVVDVLAPVGEGERAFHEYIGKRGRRYNADLGVFRARQRFADITYEELHDISCAWVDSALSLGETDLRKIDRFASSQDRRVST